MSSSTHLLPICALLAVSSPSRADAVWYAMGARVALRSAPNARSAVVTTVDHNQTLRRLGQREGWLQVQTLAGTPGYVRRQSASNIWIKVHKQERRLMLMRGYESLKRYRIALSPQNPRGDKQRLGDGATPEGRFFIAEMTRDPGAPRYGARSMRLSYPNVRAARRGLAQRLITYPRYRRIVSAVRTGAVPDQRTRLGSSIRIHGGGSSRDWTAGCMALDDRDVIELFGRVHQGARVDVYASAAQERQLSEAMFLNRAILHGAKAQLSRPALYTSAGLGLIKIKYPLGDIRRDWAVCTDVVVRAMRHAALDLQALVHEDALADPKAYRRVMRRPNYHIDHRRARTIAVYLSRHAAQLPNDRSYLAGDIVLMDTGIVNGTKYDHIGVVGDQTDGQGLPQVINIWTVGHRTASMDLLGNDYPTIVGHFRMSHPFEYH